MEHESESEGKSAVAGSPDFGAVIVGAGFGGLRMLYELRQRGVSAIVIEDASDVGGTWFWNRYPGARTDSEAWVYCFSFDDELAQEWDWPERYSAQPDVLRYLQHVADRYDLRRDIQFDTRVESARYDEAKNTWLVTTNRGHTFTSTFFIPATGPLSRPLDPPFEALDSFEGEWYLTARWPSSPVDLTGKRVGVIGTGATGIQVVPVVAESAAHVTVFQRTPNYVVPAGNRKLTDAERQQVKDRYADVWALTQRQIGGFAIEESTVSLNDVPPEERPGVLQRAWDAGGFQFLFDTFNDVLVDDEANETASEFIRDRIRGIVHNPVTAETLCPKDYPFGAKRPPLGHSYYEAFNRGNVSLIDVSDNPIERITPGGVRTSAGDHELEVLIFATGFDGSTGSLMAMDIRGRGGEALNDKWAAGPRTYLGIAVDGFPNMFMISGPQSPFGNIPVVVENAVRWIGRAVSHALHTACPYLEPSPAFVDRWVTSAERLLNASLIRKGEAAHSWFLGANVEGKPHAALFYFGRANTYFDRLRGVADSGFEGFVTSLPKAGLPKVEGSVTT